MTSGIPGSGYRPREWTRHRLGQWRRYAEAGWKAAEIAAELGMSEAALNRFVQRARKRGEPDAILHPNFVPRGEGTARPSRTRTGRGTGRLRTVNRVI